LEKYSNKFNENVSSGSRVVSCGRTDGQTRHDEANSCFVQFCERAKKKSYSELKMFCVPENKTLLTIRKNETT